MIDEQGLRAALQRLAVLDDLARLEVEAPAVEHGLARHGVDAGGELAARQLLGQQHAAALARHAEAGVLVAQHHLDALQVEGGEVERAGRDGALHQARRGRRRC